MVSVWILAVALLAVGQAPPDPVVVRQWVSHLGAFDFPTRTEAARALRRAPAATTAAELAAAARTHQDEYVRFRAFVLLSAVSESAATAAATNLVADRNDRLRTAAYQWFEHHPSPEILARLLQALPGETSEFVRPALTRAIAAHRGDARAAQVLRPLVLRGEDLFRGSVIAALGDYGGAFAREEITAVAGNDGPLQDDAVTALGRLGGAEALPLLRALQEKAPRELQPTVSASLCLLGIDCAARLEYLANSLAFAASTNGYQPLLRGAAHGLGMLAAAGHDAAFDALVRAGGSAREEARAPIALALGTVALRDPSVVIARIERQPVAALGALLRDAFDMLSEDFEEERFGTELRRALWAAPESSTRRTAATALADMLEF